VRFVSKGTNREVVIDSLQDIQLTLSDSHLREVAEWHVEVVTDAFMDLTDVNSKVNQIIVPTEYVTPKQTLFKARALH